MNSGSVSQWNKNLKNPQPAGHACLLYAPMTTQSDSPLSSAPYKSSPPSLRPSLPPSTELHQTFTSVSPELRQDLAGCFSTRTQKRRQRQFRQWVEGRRRADVDGIILNPSSPLVYASPCPSLWGPRRTVISKRRRAVFCVGVTAGSKRL